MRSLLLLYSLLSISFYAFAQDQVIKIASGFEGFFPDRTWTNTGTIAFDSSSNNHFSATDSLHPYGIGYKSSFPASLRFQSVEVTVKAKVRAHSAEGKGSLVFSSTRNSQSTFWESRNIVVQQADTGRWIDFTASAAFPSNLTGNECELLIFFWNENGKSQIDIDDVEFVFKVKQLPSFFPSFPLYSQNNRKDFFLLTKTRDFSFLTDADSSSLIVLSALGDTLFSDYFLVLEMNSKRNKTTLPLVNPVNLSRNVRRTKIGDGVVITFKSKDICGTISIIENSAGSSLDFNSSVHFLKEKYVRRLAFALNQQIPLDRVYKVNTQVDSGYFKKEYWLEKEGYSVSNERSKLVTYRPDNLSSIQLGNFGAQVVFNFDFAPDHPLMHFPKMSKSKNIYVDQSERNYKAGDSLLSAFRFDLIPVSSEIIRIAKNPNGFPASLVWTEHADYADIRTQRAVNFGSENVVKLKDAKGGFAGWNIPVTKSVFYCNPEGQTLKFKDSRFDRTSVSIKNSSDFEEFLKELKSSDFDICLHTPDPFTTIADTMEEALKYMQSNFGSPCWIDHGYDNSPISNREDLACDGTDPKSPQFALGLWKKYGVNYLWNNYYEDSAFLNRLSFNSNFSIPYSGWSDAFPRPEYWVTPLRGDTIYSWRTGFTIDPPDGSLWSYYFSDQRLNDLVETNTDCILHCYPSRVDSSNGFYFFDGQEIKVNPEFDKTLQRLHDYSSRREIWVTTIDKLMDYRLAISKIVMSRDVKGQTVLENPTANPIAGVTVVSAVDIDFPPGFTYEKLKRRGEYVFIFTLQPRLKIHLSASQAIHE